MRADEMSRTVSVMRTALVGHQLVRFDAPVLVGPQPSPGRTIEMVEQRGRHVHVMWDDGIVLDTELRRSTEWHVYGRDDPWRRSWNDLGASIEVDAAVAVCFGVGDIETFRQRDRRRHPGAGRLGPDLRDPDADLRSVVDLLLAYPDPDRRVRDALIDERLVRGVGNVDRCETLWAVELSPWAHVGDLGHADAIRVVNAAAACVRRSPRAEPEVYGRCGQGCRRCRDTVESRPVGRYGRMLYWCPGCQTRLDRMTADDTPTMDPHPAAVKYLEELPWRVRRE